MGKRLRKRTIGLRACLALSILMGVVLAVTPAFAETLNVSGADHVYTADAQDASVDVLTVTGQKGETVYINLKKGEEVLASHLAFTLDDSNAETDANGDMVGTASVEFNADSFSNNETYTIQVYADRAQTKLLYEGTVSTLFAQYEDTKDVTPLVVRTLGASEERPFTAPETRTYNSTDYQLKSAEPQDVDGKKCYVYAPAQDLAESTEAHITYYDAANATGDPIKTETVALAKDESKKVEVPAVIDASDGTLYRTLQLTGEVTVSYPGTTEYSIMCKQLSSDWGKVGSFFTATINYTDTDGNKLGGVVDRVVVNKLYLYTPPTKLFLNESGTVKEYELANNEILNAQGALELKPGMAEGSTEFNIAYAPVADDAERTWTVVLENGSVAPNDSNRVIKRIDYKGAPGTEQTHTTEQSITVDGVEYVPTAAAQDSYKHTFQAGSMDVTQTIYYVPADYVAPEAYEVAVKYVNIATNEVIDTVTYTASPMMRSDLEISSPESFSSGGVEWIRLTGQEEAILHSYYSSAREYVVYYRDVNDDLHAATVVRTVRVVYVDEQGNTVTRPTTVIDNGTTTTDAGTTTTATADGTAATATGLQTDQNLLAVDGADGGALVNEDGTDMATTRIEDNETPMASNPNANNAAAKANSNAVLIGIIAAAIAAAAGIFLFVYKRRKQSDDESSDDDLTA